MSFDVIGKVVLKQHDTLARDFLQTLDRLVARRETRKIIFVHARGDSAGFDILGTRADEVSIVAYRRYMLAELGIALLLDTAELDEPRSDDDFFLGKAREHVKRVLRADGVGIVRVVDNAAVQKL